MKDLVVLVPVLGRPHRVKPLLEQFEAVTTIPHRILFLTDPDDDAERFAIASAGADELACGGTYPTKINCGVAHTTEPLLFFGADDLVPQPGWIEAALEAMASPVEVVGVNDLIPRATEHATHFLIGRAGAMRPTIDGQPGPCFTGYRHSFVDNELIATAARRGVYAYAAHSHVRHEHWMNGRASLDDTYRKANRSFRRDRRIFHSRQELWA